VSGMLGQTDCRRQSAGGPGRINTTAPSRHRHDGIRGALEPIRSGRGSAGTGWGGGRDSAPSGRERGARSRASAPRCPRTRRRREPVAPGYDGPCEPLAQLAEHLTFNPPGGVVRFVDLKRRSVQPRFAFHLPLVDTRRTTPDNFLLWDR
jgi:hypothetical protein